MRLSLTRRVHPLSPSSPTHRQHTDEGCLPGSVLPQHHQDFTVRELARLHLRGDRQGAARGRGLLLRDGRASSDSEPPKECMHGKCTYLQTEVALGFLELGVLVAAELLHHLGCVRLFRDLQNAGGRTEGLWLIGACWNFFLSLYFLQKDNNPVPQCPYTFFKKSPVPHMHGENHPKRRNLRVARRGASTDVWNRANKCTSAASEGLTGLSPH